ncbi:4-hydroxythreonine-4-phosphate dehydrogenase PdxA [Paenalcaligenes sp.]|uniref:4-hydroxythreonine-4-phosphate dehydrogenase PdxA n=1 Tax=Paenalcaligenes sp. TaxID=1966342 RepID=UPI0026226865|nr:4-hydroxythreonine-4-phosphate dehydrogenase PdxA [Paenalcaligenes sp.]
MTHNTVLPIGITMGDAAGIGPEIILKSFAAGLPYPAVVYGDALILKQQAKDLGIALPIISIASPRDIPDQGIGVLNRWQPLPTIAYGQVQAQAGRGAYEYLCHAIDDAIAQKIRAIVTAPLHKDALLAGGIDAPGHTEILAQRTGTTDFAMMLSNPELRVILVTIHVPITAVSPLLSIDKELRTIRLAHQACLQAGIKRPRVAVAGLNPHAGENGRFGNEEALFIEPAILAARNEGIDATGPWPGDTIFMRARRGEFDIVVAQYHDQGLIPVKYLGVEQGVNTTIGLPFIRTSVDHGTAYDIAGQGIADPTSLQVAFSTALQMTQGVSHQP